VCKCDSFHSKNCLHVSFSVKNSNQTKLKNKQYTNVTRGRKQTFTENIKKKSLAVHLNFYSSVLRIFIKKKYSLDFPKVLWIFSEKYDSFRRWTINSHMNKQTAERRFFFHRNWIHWENLEIIFNESSHSFVQRK
jgi:hypothetical protein